MPLHIAILSRNARLYSTRRLLSAARDLGHFAEVLDYTKVNAVTRPAGSTQLAAHAESLHHFDAVLGRVGTTHTPLGAAVLAAFVARGTLCSPTAIALLLARDKYRATLALQANGVPVPATAMLNDIGSLDSIVEQLGGYPAILKLLTSTQGAGVILLPDVLVARSTLEAFAGLHQGVLLQEYISETGGADVRAIVCGGSVVAAMTRTPPANEFRSNVHRGGTPAATQLTENETQVVIRAASAVGLAVAGVDFLRSNRGPLVMEVNASPGLEGIEGATGVDVAAAIIKSLGAGLT